MGFTLSGTTIISNGDIKDDFSDIEVLPDVTIMDLSTTTNTSKIINISGNINKIQINHTMVVTAQNYMFITNKKILVHFTPNSNLIIIGINQGSKPLFCLSSEGDLLFEGKLTGDVFYFQGGNFTFNLHPFSKKNLKELRYISQGDKKTIFFKGITALQIDKLYICNAVISIYINKSYIIIPSIDVINSRFEFFLTSNCEFKGIQSPDFIFSLPEDGKVCAIINSNLLMNINNVTGVSYGVLKGIRKVKLKVYDAGGIKASYPVKCRIYYHNHKDRFLHTTNTGKVYLDYNSNSVIPSYIDYNISIVNNSELNTELIYLYAIGNYDDTKYSIKFIHLTSKKDGVINVNFLGYHYKDTSGSWQIIGNFRLIMEKKLHLDDLIYENNINVVLEYTELEVTVKLYDYLKLLWVNNIDNDSQYCIRVKDLLDFGSINIEFDPFLSGKPAQKIGNLIKIRAETYTGNIKTKGIIKKPTGFIFKGTEEDNTGETSLLILRGLIETSIYIDDIHNNVQGSNYINNYTGDCTILFKTPIGVNNNHSLILNRLGYNSLSLVFNTNDKIVIETPLFVQIVDQDGIATYRSTLTSSLIFTYNEVTNIVNCTLTSSLSATEFFDDFEKFLITLDGCKWLLVNNLKHLLRYNFGNEYLIFPPNVTISGSGFRISAFIKSQSYPFDVTVNGNVIYNVSSDSQLLSLSIFIKQINEKLNTEKLKNLLEFNDEILKVRISKVNSSNFIILGGVINGKNELSFSSGSNDIRLCFNIDNNIHLDSMGISNVILNDGVIKDFEIRVYYTKSSDNSVNLLDFVSVLPTESKNAYNFNSLTEYFHNRTWLRGKGDIKSIEFNLHSVTKSNNVKFMIDHIIFYERKEHEMTMIRPINVNVCEIASSPISSIKDIKNNSNNKNSFIRQQ